MSEIFDIIIDPTLETLSMVSLSTFFSLLMGFPLGVILVLTDKGGISECHPVNWFIGSVVNICRSFPFIILMILVFPLSRFIVGTSIGTTATIVPLSISAAPFVARIIEGALKEVHPGVIEAARAMGSGKMEIILKVLIPEALPAIVNGVTLTIINLIGYSAMAGAIGGGGIGYLAIREGYYKFNMDILFIAVVVLLILVQGVQASGNFISNKLIKKR